MTTRENGCENNHVVVGTTSTGEVGAVEEPATNQGKRITHTGGEVSTSITERSKERNNNRLMVDPTGGLNEMEDIMTDLKEMNKQLESFVKTFRRRSKVAFGRLYTVTRKLQQRSSTESDFDSDEPLQKYATRVKRGKRKKHALYPPALQQDQSRLVRERYSGLGKSDEVALSSTFERPEQF